MTLKINGETKEFAQGISLNELIVSLGLENKVMAAAVNMNVVKQEKWVETVLNENDSVELLDFVGGG